MLAYTVCKIEVHYINENINSVCSLYRWLSESQKVGEGVYGEVFMLPREKSRNVLKIIPIEGNILVNGEKQKKYFEITNELLIAV